MTELTRLRAQIEAFAPYNEQEEADRRQILADIETQAKALLAQGFHLTCLRACGSDLDEIYSRYFVKAGEQHEGSRGNRIFRHRRDKAGA